MNLKSKAAVLVAGLAVGATPALALAHGSAPTTTHTNATKACSNESKHKTSGEKRSDFSKCVSDMVRLANGSVKNPTVACKNESKKKAPGTKGRTPYAKCVSDAAKMHRLERSGGTGTTTSTTTSTTTTTGTTT
jgi:hypothetical protein